MRPPSNRTIERTNLILILSSDVEQEGSYSLAMAASAGEIARVEPFDVIEFDIGDMFGLPPREP
jgi:hypothetical protein